MIVDASALLAVALSESDGRKFAGAMAAASRVRIAAPNWLEAAMVVDRRGDPIASNLFDEIVKEVPIEIAAISAAHAASARQAWRDYGRGAHPAKLNFGDCLAYGFAKIEGEKLLFKGNDFSRTDIEPALKD